MTMLKLVTNERHLVQLLGGWWIQTDALFFFIRYCWFMCVFLFFGGRL